MGECSHAMYGGVVFRSMLVSMVTFPTRRSVGMLASRNGVIWNGFVYPCTGSSKLDMRFYYSCLVRPLL